jgi:hypothetical protein
MEVKGTIRMLPHPLDAPAGAAQMTHEPAQWADLVAHLRDEVASWRMASQEAELEVAALRTQVSALTGAVARADELENQLDSAQHTVSVLEKRASHFRDRAESMETLRPVWAQGWSNDSMAAQASASALAQLWHMLSASNQTEAVVKLRAILAAAEKGDSHE